MIHVVINVTQVGAVRTHLKLGLGLAVRFELGLGLGFMTHSLLGLFLCCLNLLLNWKQLI